jgi:hypothetical protein
MSGDSVEPPGKKGGGAGTRCCCQGRRQGWYVVVPQWKEKGWRCELTSGHKEGWRVQTVIGEEGEAGVEDGWCTPSDEGMTNRPSTFAYLVFGPGEIVVEGVARPIRTAAGRGPGATLGVQARIRRVQVELVLD